MKKSLLLFALILSVQTFSHPVRLTASYFGGAGNDILHDVAFADDGTLIVVGTTNNISALAVHNSVPKYLFGTDIASSQESAYILRLSNDGHQILSFSRFATGSIKIKDLRLAVTENGIYIVAVGYSGLKNITGFTGLIDNVAGVKPAIIRISLDGSQILNATYLGGFDSDRDVNDIDVFPNGDLCVNHDKGGDWADYLSRIKPDLSGFVWTRTFDVWCGSARTNAVAVSPQGDVVYVGGYGMGNTGLEPYKDPYLLSFNGDDGSQNWKRGANTKDYGVFNFPQAAIGKNRLISDSQVNALATDSLGNALMIGYSDGGATVFQYEPWYGGYNNTTGTPVPAGISDGDSFAGFGGATSASTIGLMNKNGEWIRMHAIKPYNTWNRWYGLTRGFNNSVFYAGRTSGIPDVNAWEIGGSSGVLMKVVYDPVKGTQRKFVTHPAGVDVMNKVARDRNTYRYAAVGTATSANVFCVNPLQNTYGGGNDGYLVVFDDNDTPLEADNLQVVQDADVRWGTNADKNFGTSGLFTVKRRDSRPYETAKSYLEFNLMDLNKPIIDARLLIYKSGKYDNGDAIIYALRAGFDKWSENTVTWNNAPANITNSPWRIDPLKADSIANLKIYKTNSAGLITVQGVEFSRYLEDRRLAGDLNITFAITSGTNITEQNEAILSGVSKESTSTLSKPQLQLIYSRNPSIPQNMRFWPENIKLLPRETRKFYANLFDQYGSVMNSNVTFSVNNGGTISSEGVFQASAPGVFTLTAQSEGITATTTVTIDTSTRLKNATFDSYNLIVVDKNATVLSADKLPFDVSILNVDGKLLQRSTNNYLKSDMQLNYPAGVYFVQIRSAAKSITNKIIVY